MDDEIVVLYQRLIDGVVVSVGVDARTLAAVKHNGFTGSGPVTYRMRKATEREMQDWRDLPRGNGELPKGTPV